MRLADLRLGHLHHGADERTRRVVLAAVAPGVAHVADLGLVEVRELVLLGLRAEAQLVDLVDDLAHVVAALDLVLDLAEDLADLVLDRVRPGGLLLEAVQVGKQLAVDEVAQVVAGQGDVVGRACRPCPWARPKLPSGRAHRGCRRRSCPQGRPGRRGPAPGRRGTSGTAARTSARCSCAFRSSRTPVPGQAER